MKRILIITSGLTAGGVESLMLNTFGESNPDDFHFSILTYYESPDDWAYKFEEIGCTVLRIHSPGKLGTWKSITEYKRIIQEGNYDIIHCQTGFGCLLPLLANTIAKGKRIFICHSHFDNYPIPTFYKVIERFLFNVIPCKKMACSYGAGYEVYGKSAKFTFLKNGIDSKKFSFNRDVRNEVRKELGVKDTDFVVGTVGRMTYQKNHEFLVNVFAEIHDKTPSKLVLVGDGELRDDIKSQVDRLGLTNDVLFLGKRNDVYRLLQGLDVFIMPTRFEGLSLALLEVECAGLPCLTSDQVPKEAKVTDNFEMLPLEKGNKYWAERALYYKDRERKDGSTAIETAGFDKVSAAKAWLDIYINRIKDF